MSAHRRRRCANIKPTLFQCVVFAGLPFAEDDKYCHWQQRGASAQRLATAPHCRHRQQNRVCSRQGVLYYRSLSRHCQVSVSPAIGCTGRDHLDTDVSESPYDLSISVLAWKTPVATHLAGHIATSAVLNGAGLRAERHYYLHHHHHGEAAATAYRPASTTFSAERSWTWWTSRSHPR